MTKAPARKTASAARVETFKGYYVTEFCEVVQAALLSGSNTMFLGSPGYGKTSMLLAAIRATRAKHSFTRFEPSTPPDKIFGALDPVELMKGKYVRIVEGKLPDGTIFTTPYAPGVNIVVFDEFFRANDVVYDAAMDTTDRLDLPRHLIPTVFGTANFVTVSERIEGLIDRFPMWQHLNPDIIDVAGIVAANLGNTKPALPWTFPEWKEIEEVRAMEPGPHALNAISNQLQTLAEEATKKKFTIHPRRIAAWTQLVYRVAAHAHGAADFSDLPLAATKILRFAWPAPKFEDSTRWQLVANAVVDPLASIIESVKAQALAKFKAIALEQTAALRTARMGEAGAFLGEKEAEIKKQSTTDARVKETIELIKLWMSSAMAGDPPDE